MNEFLFTTEGGFLFFVLAGFLAQLVDGTLGMAYGVSCTTLLLCLGVGPAAASASIHTSELFTTAASALFHLKNGNVDKGILKRLAVPGVVGGVIGAYVLSSFPGDNAKPWISAYHLIMGNVIRVNACRKQHTEPQNAKLAPLGFLGGFLDAVGGGGWGPVVTSTLVSKGNSPRMVIGTVNTAEFFVAASTSAAFFVVLGNIYLTAVLGLILGGVAAAPIAAHACKKVQPKPLMVAVGVLIVFLSLRNIHQIPQQIASLHSTMVAAGTAPAVH